MRVIMEPTWPVDREHENNIWSFSQWKEIKRKEHLQYLKMTPKQQISDTDDEQISFLTSEFKYLWQSEN